MKLLFLYIYYRIAKAYKDIFGIEDAPGYFLIQSCYSWGVLVLMTVLCSYTLAIETMVLWKFGIRINTWLIIITFLPFGIFYFFAEHFLGDLKTKYKNLERMYRHEKLSWLKGVAVLAFVVLSFICFMVALSHCK
jgi:hypothetical protein